MRILLIGGNGFIGTPLVRELREAEHELAIFHRGADANLPTNVVRIQGDRNRLDATESRFISSPLTSSST